MYLYHIAHCIFIRTKNIKVVTTVPSLLFETDDYGSASKRSSSLYALLVTKWIQDQLYWLSCNKTVFPLTWHCFSAVLLKMQISILFFSNVSMRVTNPWLLLLLLPLLLLLLLLLFLLHYCYYYCFECYKTTLKLVSISWVKLKMFKNCI